MPNAYPYFISLAEHIHIAINISRENKLVVKRVDKSSANKNVLWGSRTKWTNKFQDYFGA